MSLPNLLRTSAFRLTLMYMALFAVSVLVLLGYVYWSTTSYLDERTYHSIKTETGLLLEQYRRFGLAGLRHEIAERDLAGDDADEIYALVDRDYTLLAGNLPAWPAALRGHSGWLEHPFLEEEEDDEGPASLAARALAIELPGGHHLLVGHNPHEYEDLQEHTVQVLAVAIGLSLILALGGGLVMSNGILHRIEVINRTGRSIMAGHLERRVPVTGSGDEFDQLAIQLNAMLDQIQRLMDGMRHVTDNVAHDLRSPLSRLRSRLEVALLTPRSNDEYRSAIEQTLSDADGILATFNALLSIAQAEAGARREDWQRIDMGKLVRELAELYQPLGGERGIGFTQRIEEGLPLRGDRHLLAQAIGNLIDNALKYTSSGGQVELRAGKTRDGVEIIVADNGPGIPADARERVLERFVRLESSRTTPGNGLGLSMVRAVAQLHNAKLELGDNRPGLIVRLSFPSPVSD